MKSTTPFQFPLKALLALPILFSIGYYLITSWLYEFNFSDSIYVVVAMRKNTDTLILPCNDHDENGELLYRPGAVSVPINKCKVEVRKDGKTDCTIKFRDSFFRTCYYQPKSLIILIPNNGELEKMLSYWQEAEARANLEDKKKFDDGIDKIKTILDLSKKNK